MRNTGALLLFGLVALAAYAWYRGTQPSGGGTLWDPLLPGISPPPPSALTRPTPQLAPWLTDEGGYIHVRPGMTPPPGVAFIS